MRHVASKTYSVFDALDVLLTNRLNMAAYRLPGEPESATSLVVQKYPYVEELTDLSRIPLTGGFLVAPFSSSDNKGTYLIRPDFQYRNQLTQSQFDSLKSLPPVTALNGSQQIAVDQTKKSEFIQQIRHTIEQIKSGIYDKVVLSRVKIIKGNYSSDLVTIFRLLCESCPNAFVYLFRVNGHCWMGATPEPLICTWGDQIYTVSLAGTRPYSEENTSVSNWNHKEIVEQEYVTKYIENILTRFSISNITKKGPYTKKAGKLLHLRTDFFFPSEAVKTKLASLILALHPTSAVCGIPMEESLEFIKQFEKHPREYYSGFLGPVGPQNTMQLYVNLRCMKILENRLVLYMGGGITSESVPEEEWEETEIKADTLLSIIQQI